uniref:Uncharacterized protein n=1 Tax=Fagus sylvatica TaxID=28930 RepID=A0A2N9GEY7_FAGSY
MGPAQPFMDIDMDIKPHITATVAPNKEKISSLKNSDGKGLRCRSNCEGIKIEAQAMLGDQSTAPNFPEDLEVDIIGSTTKSDIGLTKSEDPDATEYSSSFADTNSGTENCSGLSEGEVESQFFGDNSLASPFDAFSSAFQMRLESRKASPGLPDTRLWLVGSCILGLPTKVRKKKLTNQWRSFIRPLMWRCKWTELRIKEMESQALKYGSELAAYDQRKHSGFNQFTFEGLELKKSDPDGNAMADDFGNPVITEQNDHCNDKFGISNDWSFFEFRDGDNFLEQVLWKIEMVHSRVHKLKSQIDVVMSKNAAKFSSSENLSLLAPYDAQTSSAHSPTFSAGNGDAISVGPICTPPKHISEYDNGDIAKPESAISSYGEAAIHVPDIIESTVGLLSATDVTLHQPQIGDSCEDIVDNVLIHTEVAEAETHTLNKIDNQATETHQEAEIGEQEESTNLSLIPTSEPLTVEKSVGSQEQSTLKSCLASDVQFPRNKRKRGERKAGSVGWNKKSSGETESQ